MPQSSAARSAQEANDTIRSFLSLHFSHFCRPPTDSASHWRTKMAGALGATIVGRSASRHALRSRCPPPPPRPHRYMGDQPDIFDDLGEFTHNPTYEGAGTAGLDWPEAQVGNS